MLYEQPDGSKVITHSMAKTFLMCPLEAYYKYHLRLKPKKVSKPLTRGKWFHSLLEHYYQKPESDKPDWETVHKRWSYKFSQLFDEEKDELGDLPNELYHLMKSYLWHYRDEDLDVKEVELKLEAELPNGVTLRGRVDFLVETEYGLFIGDHKTHKTLPDWNNRMLDMQHPYYIWLARKNGIPVRGFFWNYIKTESISTPELTKAGDRFYSRTFSGTTDYPTLVQAIKQAKANFPDQFLKDPEEKARVKQLLSELKERRYSPNKPQTSPHFRRDILEPSEEQIDRTISALMRTADRMDAYDVSDIDCIERSTMNCKSFVCNYKDLAIADLVHGDSSIVQRNGYTRHDPMEYYGDEEENIA